jgi:hypothetical protein
MSYVDLGTYSKPVETAVIRTPAAGPDPLNVLAFVRFRAAGADVQSYQTDLYRTRVRFLTKFAIDGYSQAEHEWYERNTLVSATVSLTMMNIVDNMGFVMAVDAIQPFLDLTGALGFIVDSAIQGEDYVTFSMKGAAYVACYEPQRERRKEGKYMQRGALASSIADQQLWPMVSGHRPMGLSIRDEATLRVGNSFGDPGSNGTAGKRR